ncbi:DUF4405 domain-containing protein [Motiliproteus sp.]|uniref:DUF4405 domain-containing protein n=1 Tax=Motiliproteus sp. TaxID=1898955 RepID=UPI003BA841B7
MKLQTREWSTPLIIGSSLIVTVTGVMLFFHLAEGLIMTAHEWIGVAFVAIVGLHVLNHWKPFKRYFYQKRALSLILGTFLIAGVLLFSGDKEPHPLERVARQMEQSSIRAMAALQHRPVDELRIALESEGLRLTGNEQTLAELAQENDVHLFRLIELLFAQPAKGA